MINQYFHGAVILSDCIVSEPEKVVFVRPLEGRIVLSLGMRHELECVAEGQPEPQYVWLKDDDIIDKDDGFLLTNSTRYFHCYYIRHVNPPLPSNRQM